MVPENWLIGIKKFIRIVFISRCRIMATPSRQLTGMFKTALIEAYNKSPRKLVYHWSWPVTGIIWNTKTRMLMKFSSVSVQRPIFPTRTVWLWRIFSFTSFPRKKLLIVGVKITLTPLKTLARLPNVVTSTWNSGVSWFRSFPCQKVRPIKLISISWFFVAWLFAMAVKLRKRYKIGRLKNVANYYLQKFLNVSIMN